jgi:acetyl esterase/lipase
MTTTNDSPPAFQLPAREIPIPRSVSPEAQAMLALGPITPEMDWPPLDDLEAWRKKIAEMNAAVQAMVSNTASAVGESRGEQDQTSTEEITVAGVPVFVITPRAVDPNDRHVILDIHGGGFVLGGGPVCRWAAAAMAPARGACMWAPDFRMPPDDPFPAGLDDCVAVYEALLEERNAEEIIVSGVSAGGNMAAALMLRIHAAGLPMPAALVLDTPAVDLTASSDSWITNLGLDTVLTGTSSLAAVDLYRGNRELRDPYISPVFGDLSGFPPTILTTGTRDRLLSDTVRMHRALRAAGVDAELHVWEAAGHGMFLGTAPEDADKAREIRGFLDEHWEAK